MARLSCFLQFLFLPHSQPFLSCKQLHSFRLHYISAFRFAPLLTFHFAYFHFSHFAVHRLLIIKASLRVASGCGLSWFLYPFLFHRLTKNQASPCVFNIVRHRPHSAMLHCVLFGSHPCSSRSWLAAHCPQTVSLHFTFCSQFPKAQLMAV